MTLWYIPTWQLAGALSTTEVEASIPELSRSECNARCRLCFEWFWRAYSDFCRYPYHGTYLLVFTSTVCSAVFVRRIQMILRGQSTRRGDESAWHCVVSPVQGSGCRGGAARQVAELAWLLENVLARSQFHSSHLHMMGLNLFQCGWSKKVMLSLARWMLEYEGL